jgi:predicted nucleic acid-binding protein
VIAFDADVLTEILAGDAALAARAAHTPPQDQAVPIIVIEEILRGRLNAIRQAEAGKSNLTVSRAYELFEQTLDAFRHVVTLPYSPAADAVYQEWRKQKTRGGTHDLRIAAICRAHSATLVTRNQRDFDGLPGLALDVWA